MKKWIIVLRLASQTVPQKIEYTRFIVESMTDNEHFPSPIPELKTITRLADELQLAYTQSRDAGKEQTAIMHAKDFELEIELIALSNYVQDIANKDNEIGDIIIFSAGMDVKRQQNRQDRKFRVENTVMAGRVKLQTISEGRAGYQWEFSLDQENWIPAGVTIVASTIINNLEPGKRYYFRVAAIKGEQGPWLGPVNTIVT
jgi:hypothetical protein